MVDKEEKEQIRNVVDSIRKRREVLHSTSCQSEEEFLVLANLVKKCNHLHGDFAEIGAYEGFTSEFIKHFIEKGKVLFLCDTFEGLADVSSEDPKLNISNGQLKVDIERFKHMNPFHDDPFVSIVPGYFPESATHEMNSSRYAFVHIDTDTHKSTMLSLQYFYPRMVNGGIIVVHDYRNHQGTAGVKKAVNDFMIDKEDALSTSGGTTQGIITKI